MTPRKKGKPMLAFHGDSNIKEKYLSRVIAHRAADELVKGQYWSKGKGCAVGCTIHGDQHKAYETELGIPEVLARLEDGIFENLPNELAMVWPERFLSAIPVGKDLTKVWHHFVIWLLGDAEHGTMRLCDPAGAAATKTVIELYQREIAGEVIPSSAWDAARDAAWDAARDAARAAAWDAARAAARDAARAAARDAAWAAARAAAGAAAWAAAGAAARDAHYVRMSDKLISLLAEA
jgi:hypothetical protein